MAAKQSQEMRKALAEYERLKKLNRPVSIPKLAAKHDLHHSSLYRAIGERK